MKPIILLLLAVTGIVLAGCGDSQPLPDTSTERKPLPPGTKTNDVLLPINK